MTPEIFRKIINRAPGDCWVSTIRKKGVMSDWGRTRPGWEQGRDQWGSLGGRQYQSWHGFIELKVKLAQSFKREAECTSQTLSTFPPFPLPPQPYRNLSTQVIWIPPWMFVLHPVSPSFSRSLTPGVTKFFCKGLDRKYVRLREAGGLCCHYAALPL